MTVYAVFPSLYGPDLACAPLLSDLREHFQRRGVLIFTHPNHRKRQADVHSTSVYLNGVAIQTLRRGVEHDLSQAEGAGSSWHPTAFSTA